MRNVIYVCGGIYDTWLPWLYKTVWENPVLDEELISHDSKAIVI